MSSFSAAVKLAAIIVAMTCAGCDMPKEAPQAKNEQAQKAAQAANAINFTENAEIDNIKRRLELTSKPAAVGFIMLINQAGQPILYASVKGKVTSGGKRLTKPYERAHWDCGQAYCDKELPGPSDEGTYGSSGEYVYFWTAGGQYYQWAGNYLYSDQPFRLKVEPLVIDVKAP